MIEYGASLFSTAKKIGLHEIQKRTKFDNEYLPSEMSSWYFEKAKIEKCEKLAKFYFEKAASVLIDDAGLTFELLNFLKLQANSNPLFHRSLKKFVSYSASEGKQDIFFELEKVKKERKNKWATHFRQYFIGVGAVDYQDPSVLGKLALVYRGGLRRAELRSETPHQRLVRFFNGDLELIDAVYAGFRHVLDRSDLPSCRQIIDMKIQGKVYAIRHVCLVGMIELYRYNQLDILNRSDALLATMLAFYFTSGISRVNKECPFWVSNLISKRLGFVAEIYGSYLLSLTKETKEEEKALFNLFYNNQHHAKLVPFILPGLLNAFSYHASQDFIKSMLHILLAGGVAYLDKTVILPIVESKTDTVVDVFQRGYWLACAFTLAPTKYMRQLQEYLSENGASKKDLASFLCDCLKDRLFDADFSEKALGFLIEDVLVPVCSFEQYDQKSKASIERKITDLVYECIGELRDNIKRGSCELQRLFSSSKLANWHTILKDALETKLRIQYQASFFCLGPREVMKTLSNKEPSNVADLAAVTFFHLRDIARKIRDCNTNDYRQYWSYDTENKFLVKSKPENDCRDILLSDLNQRLNVIGVDGQAEGNYADNKRADIRIAFNRFNLPIEIKKDSHRDLCGAVNSQLISKYIRDPATGGHGIYLVFWFGEKKIFQFPDGEIEVQTPQELEVHLRGLVSKESSYNIQFCVIDCALPLKMQRKG